MNPFDIVSLVAAVVAIIVGAIVFLVLFFRCMSWIDVWMRGQNQTASQSKSARRRRKAGRPAVKPTPLLAERARLTDPQKTVKTIRPNLVSQNGRAGSFEEEQPVVRSARAFLTERRASLDRLGANMEPPHNGIPRSVNVADELAEECGDTEATNANSGRTVSIHLLTGEIFSPAILHSQQDTERMRLESGMDDAIVFEVEGQQWVAVHPNNIKMVTWHSNCAKKT